MPELPEVETTLRGVLPHLSGRRVSQLIVRQKQLRWPVPDELQAIEQQVISGGQRRAKYLLFTTPAGTLLIHLGMSGSLRIQPSGSSWRKHDHLALSLDNGMDLRFHDPRRFGCLLWLTDDPSRHPLLQDLGPEPLSPAFNAASMHQLARKRSAPIKSFIMDGHNVVGVGNIYACESLFIAGIKPGLPAAKLSRPRWEKLVAAIQQVLSDSIAMGGTTLRDFLNERGEPGYFKQTLRVYDREGLPCPTCQSPIKRRVQAQRSTFYCTHCQK
jgi:formamidopyrimidine-DNA glycosylase